MGEIKRYDFVHLGGDFYSVMEEQNGMYVTHEDYAALKDERDKLAAENAAAIDAVTVFSKATEDLTEIIGDEIGMDGVAKLLAGFSVFGNMPATDAYFAEIRAQAVDEFAAAQMEISHEKRACGQNDLADIYHDNANDAIVFAKRIRAAAKENNHICKGTNCTSDSFTPHSPECEKEHDKVVRGEE